MNEWWENRGMASQEMRGLLSTEQFLRIAGALELPSIYGFSQDWETSFNSQRPSIQQQALPLRVLVKCINGP